MSDERKGLSKAELKGFVKRLSDALDGIPRDKRDEELWRIGAVKNISHEERRELIGVMRVVEVAINHYKTALMGWGSPNLFNLGCSPIELLSLLNAIDPSKLSLSVMDALNNDIGPVLHGPHGSAWQSLPKPLADVLYARMEERDEAHLEQQEADDEQDDESPTQH